MKAGILSSGLWGLGAVREASQTEEALIDDRKHLQVADWKLEEFERQQVRGLVRQLFLPGANLPARQVVFSAIEPETDIGPLCQQVGELLAAETSVDVALVDERQVRPSFAAGSESDRADGMQSRVTPEPGSRRVGSLFRLPSRIDGGGCDGAKPLHLYMEELRRTFEYSIVAAPAAANSNEPMAMAHFADGIVLVLSAQRTRRPTALRVKNALSGVHLLGTVLCEREFPIPWGIYRRL